MILLGTWVILILLGLLNGKNRYILFFQAVFVIFMMGMLNIYTVDHPARLYNFNILQHNPAFIFSGNWGYQLFNYILGRFVSFEVTMFILSLLGVLILIKSISRYSQLKSEIFALYMLTPFVIDVTQIKNFFAMSIWLYFSYYIVSPPKENSLIKNSIIYILGIFLVGSFHSAFYITLFFVIVPYISIFKSSVIALLAITLGNAIPNLMNILVSTFGNYLPTVVVSKYYAYKAVLNLDIIKTRETMIISFFILFIFAITPYILQIKNNQVVRDSILVNNIIKINILALISLPLLSFSTEFYRLQRNLLILVYIVVLQSDQNIAFGHRFKIRISKVWGVIFAIILAFFYLYVDTIRWNFESVFQALFRF
ncbi:hypothetical protein NOL12_02570 [Streptococcus suis]|nr:hypothetical protein [Streptococcus suis]QCO71382.1 Wzy [Streptococcus suis]